MASDSNLHVFHVINSLDRGGAETNLARLCRATGSQGVVNEVVTLRDGGVLRDSLLRDLPAWRFTAPVDHWRLRRSLAGTPHALVMGWMYLGCVAATLLAPRSVPMIWSLRHVPDDLGAESRSTRVALKLLAAASRTRRHRPALLLANSTDARERHQQLGLYGAYRVIANGIDTHLFEADPARGAALRQRLGIGADDLVLLQVARTHPHKGHTVLLDAAIPLFQRYPLARLLLVGRGTDELQHPALTDTAVAARIHRLGDTEDVVSCYSAADLLVNPSLTESFPTTVVEAMSCGLPCVVTDTGASREIVGAVGGVVAAANAASLLVGIDEMLRLPADARRCMGVAARQRVVECFSLARMAAEFVGAYRSATGAGA